MRYRAMFAAGLAIGYVLGARAGRERYEQIKRLVQRIADNPTLQEAAGLVGAQASKAAGKAKDFARDRFGGSVPFLRTEEEPMPAGQVSGAGVAAEEGGPAT
ncbi:hypothetical protein TBS_01680 [Thermobispora bispora]|jgi:hypothetical protein|uniref:Uncharacterized protein n=1 Tax=Thermobispora bispora (strain ATCC 19993 / DSM 43833 / CBS 139.67 / JCM 10125 / KCTC 9307 / NBRC 14880 / R51) TaxID=469371 RepID=D6Y8L5_THEBD|nr:hypothetical protein [Thermobispora bispora]ADG87912.1 hypothetical protein Tbis_1190 [Thermobispora bispora DSM 43833]MDI9579542.1 YtxH domain-containing protein [Thermobispora sp.]